MQRNKKIVLLTLGGLVAWLATRQQGQISYLVLSVENEANILMGNPTRGERNNNPGNIRPAGYTWQGQTGIDSGSMGSYVIFSSPEYGIRAIAKDLLSKYARGLRTVRLIISAYAPPSENPTESYINAVCSSMGVMSTTRLDLTDVYTLTNFVYAIIKHENGRVNYTPAQIAEGVSMALAS
jgi:hypothetical protein